MILSSFGLPPVSSLYSSRNTPFRMPSGFPYGSGNNAAQGSVSFPFPFLHCKNIFHC